MNHTDNGAGWRRWGAGAALGAAGLLAGGAIASTVTANAADSSSTSSSPSATAPAADNSAGNIDESESQRPDEQLLTGDTASKVRAAALAKYPGATVQRVESDSDGVYEVHLVTSSGERVTVEVGKDFAVTGTEAGGHGRGGHGGDSSSSSSTTGTSNA